jgi:hypothetical protein
MELERELPVRKDVSVAGAWGKMKKDGVYVEK